MTSSHIPGGLAMFVALLGLSTWPTQAEPRFEGGQSVEQAWLRLVDGLGSMSAAVL